MMGAKQSITSKANGSSYDLPNGNCKSQMVIYVAECNSCGLQHTGKTVQKLRSRISGHRSLMEKEEKEVLVVVVVDEDQKFVNEDEAALSDHLKVEHQLLTSTDFNKHYQFSVLEFCTPKKLDSSELEWI